VVVGVEAYAPLCVGLDGAAGVTCEKLSSVRDEALTPHTLALSGVRKARYARPGCRPELAPFGLLAGVSPTPSRRVAGRADDEHAGNLLAEEPAEVLAVAGDESAFRRERSSVPGPGLSSAQQEA
jgi:hypothetical protein